VEAQQRLGVGHGDCGSLSAAWTRIELVRGEPVLKLAEFHRPLHNSAAEPPRLLADALVFVVYQRSVRISRNRCFPEVAGV
jgi:hypothetical protein